MLAFLAVADLKLNFLNFVAIPISVGVGADYALNVMKRREIEGATPMKRILVQTGGAVVLCSLTTTLGYGPRYLHSTGQLHKGGPNRGMFLEITGGSAENLPIPGKGYGFETLKGAQDIGDFKALRKHRRRVLRIDLGKDVDKGLASLRHAVTEAIASLQSR